jgi:hypothetical protein
MSRVDVMSLSICILIIQTITKISSLHLYSHLDLPTEAPKLEQYDEVRMLRAIYQRA